MSIGENIKYLRKKAKLTQKELASLVGINEVTIRSYEAGKYEPKTDTLYKLRKALDCNINELLIKPFDLYDSIELTVDDLENWMEHYSKGDAPENSWQRELTILEHFRKLNKSGELKAIEQVELLSKIPEYKKDNN